VSIELFFSYEVITLEKTAGIYLIHCKKNRKAYIGQSSNISQRFMHHKSMLKNNKHKNKYLQRAWNKYGEASFEFSILEICNIELLNIKEVEFATKFKDQLFNLRGVGDYKPLNDEIRKRLATFNLGNKYSLGKRNATNWPSKITKPYNRSSKRMVKTGRKLDFQKVKSIRTDYNLGSGLSDLARKYGVHRTTIRDIIKTKIWSYEQCL